MRFSYKLNRNLHLMTSLCECDYKEIILRNRLSFYRFWEYNENGIGKIARDFMVVFCKRVNLIEKSIILKTEISFS
jgi:hypothetical protein